VRVLRPSKGESCIEEALVLIDGSDKLATLGRPRWLSWIGRSPDAVLGRASPLAANDEPHDAFVACCSCGLEGCGALIARIRLSGDLVIWDRFRSGADSAVHETLIDTDPFFEAAGYERALLGASRTSDWEPTTRRAALIAREAITNTNLGHLRLRATGFEGRGDSELIEHAFLGSKGDADWSSLRLALAVAPRERAEDLAASKPLEIFSPDRLPYAYVAG
jgi:hypothetical protein